MTNVKRQEVKNSTLKAINFWMKAQVAAGKTQEEVALAYNMPETRRELIESARRLA